MIGKVGPGGHNGKHSQRIAPGNGRADLYKTHAKSSSELGHHRWPSSAGSTAPGVVQAFTGKLLVPVSDVGIEFPWTAEHHGLSLMLTRSFG